MFKGISTYLRRYLLKRSIARLEETRDSIQGDHYWRRRGAYNPDEASLPELEGQIHDLRSRLCALE